MDAKQWKEKVLAAPKNGYDRISAAEKETMTAYCEGYKAYLDAGKTERECVTEAIRLEDIRKQTGSTITHVCFGSDGQLIPVEEKK